MTYEQYKIKPQIGTINKLCDCNKDVNKCLKKIDLNLPCGSKHFAVENYFSELVHDWEKDAARYNLGIQELDGIKYFTETTENGELLNKVTLTYRKGHEYILRTFNVAPKGEKGDDGDPGSNGLSAFEIAQALGKIPRGMTESEWIDSLKGEKGDPGNAPTLSEVDVEWVESKRDEGGEWVLTSCNTYGLKLFLHKPDAFSELQNVITLINNNLIANYVQKSELPDFNTFERKSENGHRLDFTGSTLSLIKNGSLEDSVQIPIPQSIDYTLPLATDYTLGGIKTGYIGAHESTAKHYPLYTDGNGHAYVRIPISDFETNSINITDYKGIIENWQTSATNDLRIALNSKANKTELDSFKLEVISSENGKKYLNSAIRLTPTQIALAVGDDEENVILGLVLDSMRKQNALILNDDGKVVSLIQNSDGNNTTTEITSDNIILNGTTIASEISAKQATLENVNVTGNLTAKSLILSDDGQAFFENEDTVVLQNTFFYKVIYIFTNDTETKVKSAGCNLVYKENGTLIKNSTFLKLDKNSVYIAIRTSSGWNIVNLTSFDEEYETKNQETISNETTVSSNDLVSYEAKEKYSNRKVFEIYLAASSQISFAEVSNNQLSGRILYRWGYKADKSNFVYTNWEESYLSPNIGLNPNSYYERTGDWIIGEFSFPILLPISELQRTTLRILFRRKAKLDENSEDGWIYSNSYLVTDSSTKIGNAICDNCEIKITNITTEQQNSPKTQPISNPNLNGFIVINGLIYGTANVSDGLFNEDKTVVIGHTSNDDLMAQNLTNSDLTFEYNEQYYNLKGGTTTTHLVGHATIEEAKSLMAEDLIAQVDNVDMNPGISDEPAKP